jgi:hypothetical protein
MRNKYYNDIMVQASMQLALKFHITRGELIWTIYMPVVFPTSKTDLIDYRLYSWHMQYAVPNKWR